MYTILRALNNLNQYEDPIRKAKINTQSDFCLSEQHPMMTSLMMHLTSLLLMQSNNGMHEHDAGDIGYPMIHLF